MHFYSNKCHWNLISIMFVLITNMCSSLLQVCPLWTTLAWNCRRKKVQGFSQESGKPQLNTFPSLMRRLGSFAGLTKYGEEGGENKLEKGENKKGTVSRKWQDCNRT